MHKTRKLQSKLTLHRETLQALDRDALAQANGGIFTDDCSAMPSHARCSMPCTLSY